MIKNNIILEIEKLLDNKKILDYNILSDSFGINCLKIETEDKERYIVKYYYKKEGRFNAIKSEADNILFLNSHKFNFFPKIINNNNKFLIMSFIDNNNDLPIKTNDDLLGAIISLHSKRSNNYGFNFDTQIGGLKQSNTNSKDWVEFYGYKRCGTCRKAEKFLEEAGQEYRFIDITENPPSKNIVTTASFSPFIACGTTGVTSCARKPSVSASDLPSTFQLNLDGLSCFNLVVASQDVVTFSLSL